MMIEAAADAEARPLAICVVAGAGDQAALALTLADLGETGNVLVVAPEPAEYPAIWAAWRAVGDHWGTRDFVCLRAGVRVPPDRLAMLARLAERDAAIALVSPLSDRVPYLSLAMAPPLGRDLRQLNDWLRDNAGGGSFDIPHVLDSCCWVRFQALAALADSPPESLAALENRLAERGNVVVGCAGAFVDDRAVPVETIPAVGEDDREGDPAGPTLTRLRRALNAAGQPADMLPSRPVCLHITHNWGGGVARWVADYTAADRASLSLVLRSVSGWDARCHTLELLHAERMAEPIMRWRLEQPIDATVIAHHQYRTLLREVIELTGARSLVVSSLVGHSLDALATGLPTIVAQHDYYPYCSALFLYFNEPCQSCQSCQRPRLEACQAGNEHNIHHGKAGAERWLALREHYVRAMLASNVVWVAPSGSVFRNLARLAPGLADKAGHVIEHGLPAGRFPHREASLAARRGDRLRVFVLGRLAPHKGRALFKEALPALLPHAEFVLVGCGGFGTDFEGVEGVHLVAEYRNAELADLVDAWQPDCALLLSLVPETFSYTLSELMALAVATVATRVGALAERIEDGVDGLLIEPTASALIAAVTALAADRAPLRRIEANLAQRPFRDLGAMVADYRRLLPDHLDDADAFCRAPAADLIEELLRAHGSESVLRRTEVELQGRLDRQEAEQARLVESEREAARQWRAANAQLDAVGKQLSQAETRLAEVETRLAETGARLLDSEGRLSRSESQAEAYQVEVEARGADIETLNVRLATAQAELNAVLDSTIWRTTAPLRWLVLRMRTLSRRLAMLWAAIRCLPGVVERAGGGWPAVLKVAGIARQHGIAGLRQRTRLRIAIDSETASQIPVVTETGATQEPFTPEPEPEPAPARSHDAEVSEYVEYTPDPAVASRIRAIAFYLPQFHPIPENDAWWGKGFTEWTNVAKAAPQFVGHYQPRLPGELGYYDLRVPEVQQRQVELAKQYGLSGFCFYYYWFSGKRLLERPLDQYLANRALDLPFCVCWANENWTRRWDGRDDDILMRQLYREEDEAAFIESVIPLFRDPRYIRVEGRPVLLVYRADELPEPKRAVATWRAACRAAGVGDPYLLMVQCQGGDPRSIGFDGAVEFPPHIFLRRLADEHIEKINPDYQGTVNDYLATAELSMGREWPDFTWFRGVAPAWDNEARKPGKGVVLHGSTPAGYRRWLSHVAAETDRRYPEPDKKLVFINAWNEWGEGTYLEPDRRYGYAYLQATAAALKDFSMSRGRGIVVVSHNALFHGAQLLALHMARCLREQYGYQVHVILCGEGCLRDGYAAEAMMHDWFAMADQERQALVESLVAAGVEKAICNTSVVGEVVEMLAGAGVRCVSLIHELPMLIRAQGLEASVARIAAHAETVVFPARSVWERFLDVQPIAEEKIVVRPQGLYRNNPDRHRKLQARQQVGGELALPAAARIVLGVGYADHRKGIDLFIQVAARVTASHPDAHFVWVGPKDATEIASQEALVAPLLASGHLVFAGLRDPVGPYYAAADLYLLTSREDPFPSVVLEALDAGIPVVAFADGGGYVELLREGWGDLVAMADTEAMAGAVIGRLDAGAVARERFAEAAEDMISRRFVFADYVRDLLVMLGETPRQVSVIVPNYNYARHIEERLRSILAQTRKPREIVFLDDCSTDASVEIAERILAAGDIPYRIIRNIRNLGCFRQWLNGIGAAVGDLVWIAEADDIAEPGFLETLVPSFDDETVTLAYSQSKQIDETGAVIAEDYLAYTDEIDTGKWRTAYVRPGVDEILDTLIVKNTIPNVSGVLMRKPDLAGIAPMLSGLRNAGDWLVYLHLLERGRIAYHPAPLNRHRRHGGSLTLGDERRRLMREIVAVQAHFLRRYRPSAETSRLIEQVNARTYAYLDLATEGCPGWRDDAEIVNASLEQLCAASE